MTDFTHHTPRLLSDADAAADLAGVARPDLPSVGTEDARRLAEACLTNVHEMQADERGWFEHPKWGTIPNNLLTDVEKTISALVSERDELASRVRELETEVLDQCRLNGMGAERESALMGRVRDLEGALREATDALDGGLWDYGPGQDEHTKCTQVVETCRAALSALRGVEQQPVAKFQAIYFRRNTGIDRLIVPATDNPGDHVEQSLITRIELLFATPPAAPVGEPPKRLSEAEIRDMVTDWFDSDESEIRRGERLARAIESEVLRRAGGGAAIKGERE